MSKTGGLLVGRLCLTDVFSTGTNSSGQMLAWRLYIIVNASATMRINSFGGKAATGLCEPGWCTMAFTLGSSLFCFPVVICANRCRHVSPS